MKIKILSLFLYAISIIYLSACSSENIRGEFPKTNEEVLQKKRGKLFGKPIEVGKSILEKDESNGNKYNEQEKQLAKEHYLKNNQLVFATMQSVSYMPITFFDKDNGIILTDWYEIEQGKQVRYNISIIDDILSPESFMIYGFYRTRDGSGNWGDNIRSKEISDKLIDEIISKIAK